MDLHDKKRPDRRVWAIAVPLALSLIVSQHTPALANEKMQAQQLVERAHLMVQSFICDEKMQAFRDLLPKAQGALIIPSLLEGAFMVGASGGSGVFLVRDSATGIWSDPAFYTVGGASIGVQFGGQSSEVILLAMTDRGVRALLGTSVKLGADAGIAIGPVGVGASAASANLSVDILSFSRSKGLYGGISLDGAVIAVRAALNEAYYGKEVSPTDILVKQEVMTTPEGMLLAESVARYAEGSVATGNECPGAPYGTKG
jgi:lipid-binding SYLF domain-containing protein